MVSMGFVVNYGGITNKDSWLVVKLTFSRGYSHYTIMVNRQLLVAGLIEDRGYNHKPVS